MGVAQNERARVTQVLVFGSIYQAILVHLSELQSDGNKDQNLRPPPMQRVLDLRPAQRLILNQTKNRCPKRLENAAGACPAAVEWPWLFLAGTRVGVS